MKRWLRLLALLSCIVSAGLAQGEPQSAAPAHSSDSTPPELAALQADLDEEQTVRRLQRIGIEKQRLLERAEVRGRAYVRMVRLGLLPLSDGFEHFVKHANRVESLRRGLARDLAAIARLDAEARAMRDALRNHRLRRDRMMQQLDNYQRSRDAIAAAREREAAYRRAFEPGAQRGRHTAVYGSSGDADGVASFPELKGQVPFPVHGRTEVEEQDPTAEQGAAALMWVAPGSIAKSVYKGRVVLIGKDKDGTLSVVVEHGAGYSTVSGHLRRVLVSVGDGVAAGAELGEPAERGQQAMLRFEVRHDGVNLLPAEWFGL